MRKPSNRARTFAASMAALLLIGGQAGFAQTVQEHVHHHSSTVMPFEMGKTLHLFKMTEFGGVQRVIVRDEADAEQIALIRTHLREMAERFQQGDYSAPATLHGADMPGLEDLRRGASGIQVSYTELPDGAALKFETGDRALLTAIHRWFGAQLSEHGADAKAE
jgi:hypothetical protein